MSENAQNPRVHLLPDGRVVEGLNMDLIEATEAGATIDVHLVVDDAVTTRRIYIPIEQMEPDARAWTLRMAQGGAT